MKINGGCHCGYIAYEAEVDPEQTAICHCTDCQTLSGSAFRTVIPAPDHSFRILSGEPATSKQGKAARSVRKASALDAVRRSTRQP
jgi:hypothetical protein